MSTKETCPGCDSRTSDIAQAFADNRPCPTCDLTAEAALEILRIRDSRASEAVKAEFEALRLRADRAETRAARAERRLAAIREVLGDDWEVSE